MKKTSTIYPFLILVIFYFQHFFVLSKSVDLDVEPHANPSFIHFTNVKAYTFSVSFQKISTATSYLVLFSDATTILDIPSDQKTYKKGDRLLTSKVLYVGNDTTFIPRGIRANTKYTLAIFAFNGSNGNENYVQMKPAIGSMSTPGLFIDVYYDGVSKSAPNFVSALSELTNSHKVISYTNYKTTLLQNLELIDTVGGQVFIECSYTGERKIVSEPFDWNKSGYSREHSFPHSWMPTYPADNPLLPEYSDLHNLYPANLEKANSIRSNYPLGEIDGKVTYEYLGGRLGYSGSQIVYEPRDRHKGNVARAIFYMCVAYNGMNNNAWKLPTNQDQNILKKWHFQDPPDEYEIARQEYIYSLQGNRNPFIDSANFVCSIDFSKLGKLSTCNDVPLELGRVNVNEKLSFMLVDNVFCILADEEFYHYKLVNMLGENVISSFDSKGCIYLPNGYYILTIEVNSMVCTYKLFASDF